MSEQNLGKGDLVRLSLVGRIVEVSESGYVVTIHGENVPVLKSDVTPYIEDIDKAFAKLEAIEESYRKHFGPIPLVTER